MWLSSVGMPPDLANSHDLSCCIDNNSQLTRYLSIQTLTARACILAGVSQAVCCLTPDSVQPQGWKSPPPPPCSSFQPCVWSSFVTIVYKSVCPNFASHCEIQHDSVCLSWMLYHDAKCMMPTDSCCSVELWCLANMSTELGDNTMQVTRWTLYWIKPPFMPKVGVRLGTKAF